MKTRKSIMRLNGFWYVKLAGQWYLAGKTLKEALA